MSLLYNIIALLLIIILRLRKKEICWLSDHCSSESSINTTQILHLNKRIPFLMLGYMLCLSDSAHTLINYLDSIQGKSGAHFWEGCNMLTHLHQAHHPNKPPKKRGRLQNNSHFFFISHRKHKISNNCTEIVHLCKQSL